MLESKILNLDHRVKFCKRNFDGSTQLALAAQREAGKNCPPLEPLGGGIRHQPHETKRDETKHPMISSSVHVGGGGKSQSMAERDGLPPLKSALTHDGRGHSSSPIHHAHHSHFSEISGGMLSTTASFSDSEEGRGQANRKFHISKAAPTRNDFMEALKADEAGKTLVKQVRWRERAVCLSC